MKALKIGLVVSLAAVFFLACTTEQANNNANQNSNQSSTSPTAVAPPAATGGASATANTNSPGGPGSGSGNPPAAANANLAAGGATRNTNTTPAGVTAPPSSPTAPASNIDAAALYNTESAPKCASCHGADGKGNPNIPKVPNFTDAAWQKKTTDAKMIANIKNGDKPMPPYKDKLNDAQIKALVAYIRAFAK